MILTSEHKEEISNLRKEVQSVARKPKLLGMIIFIVLFGGVGTWSMLAQIDKAALAVGEIVPSGNNKTIQHLEGGIIKEINVKEGEIVEKNQVIMTLSETSASANEQIVGSALTTNLAEYYRLIAERDNLEEIKYPDEWINGENAIQYQEAIDSQNQIFDERKKSYSGQVDILNERGNQLRSEIKGYKSQISAAISQLSYTKKEITVVEKLLRSGNTTMARLLGLKSRSAEIEGRIGELRSGVSRTEQAISENDLNIINLKNESLNEVVGMIKEVQAKINELKERSTSAKDTLSRTEIRAPVRGIITDLKFKTESGVIAPGMEIMTIVPLDTGMVAEVKISPIDIDVVEPGLKARVRLSAYTARHIPMLGGELKYVAADIIKDPQTQESYYKGRVEINISEIDKFIDINRSKPILYPGMPVEVYITTGARTPMEYMIDPITKTFRRAFREE